MKNRLYLTSKIYYSSKTKKMKKVNVMTIEHEDVRGNKLLYIKIENEGETHLINVGTKTYEAVAKVLNAKPNILQKVK